VAGSKMPRVVGFNHVALEVGDIEEALAFYGRLFEFELRGKSDSMPSSISATSSSPFRKAASRRPTTAAISVSWSTTRRQRVGR
jgi:Glyoxalase/Bleomycin resistance protein/Dioxygenase superfamily